MGKHSERDLIPQNSFYRHIGRNVDFPDNYKMSSSGLFLRESVLDIAQVEHMFATPRAFDFYMNRKTSEDWMKEQGKDNNQSAPVTLGLIESKVQLTSEKDMLIYEGGRMDYKKISDIELCKEIDTITREDFKKPSIYSLTHDEKLMIAKHMKETFYANSSQLSRCLAFHI